MAAVTLANVAKTATLVAATADTVTVAAPTGVSIEVANLSTTDTIWARVDGTATVAGDDCIPIPPSSAYIFTSCQSLSLISSGTPQYNVNRLV